MKSKYVISLLFFLIIFMIPFQLLAGTELKVDSTFQSEEVPWGRRTFIQEEITLHHKNNREKWESFLDFGVVKNKEGGKGQIYQLYLKKQFSSLPYSLKLGRFERSDSQGYYTLDGVSISKKNNNYGVKIFGGRSFRLENFQYNEGDQIVGLELNLTEPGKNNHSTHYKVGIQQNLAEVKRTSFNWAASSLRLGKLWTSEEWQFNTIGSYVFENNELDKLQLNLKGVFQKGTTLRMGYEYFTPNEISESFRDQFFHYYAFGKEEIYWGALHVQTNRRWELFCKIRQISHEKVQPGYRVNSGVKWKSFQGWNLKANFEQINLGTEQASTLFVNYSKSLTSRNLFLLEGATQNQVNKITGKNQGNGVQVKLKTMFSNRLYLTSSLMAIHNSNLDDEHRLSLKLSWITNH